MFEVFTWLRIRFSPIKPDFSRQSGKEFVDYDRDMLVYLGTHRDRIVALLEAADGMEDALLDAVADCTENQPTYSAAIKAYRAAKGGA